MSKSILLFSVTPYFFWRISQTPIQDQQNGKQTYCWSPPNSSGLTSTIYTLVFLQAPQVFISYQNIFLIFSQTVYSTMVGKTFTFMVSRLLENAFAIQKNLTQFHYVLHPQAKLFPGSYHHPQAEGNYSSYQGSIFSNIFFPPQEEIVVGKETMQ